MSDSDVLDPELHPEENENFLMAHKYMDMYVESLVDEYKAKKENAYLLQRLDQITSELKDIKGELAEVKEQGAQINESFRVLDFTRLTIGYGQQTSKDDPLEELKRFLNDSPAGAAIPPAAAVLPPTPEQPAIPAEDPPEARHGDGTAEGPETPKKLSDDEKFREAFRPKQSPGPDDPNTPAQEPPKTKTKGKHVKKTGKRRVFSIVANVLFYLCMVLLIVGAVAFSQSDNPEKSLFGYRYYYIKTASMEPVLPVGSVVITKSVPSEEIQVGDDITVYVGDGSSDSYLTHRVVELTTDQAGELAFLTKGVNNKSNDPAPFNQKLVVGKVVVCIPKLGVIMTFVRSQLWLVIGIFVLLLALSFMLRLLLTKEPDAADASQPDTGKAAGTRLTPGKKKRKKGSSPGGDAAEEKREEEARV